MVNTNSNDMIDFNASVRNFAEQKICLQPQRLQIHLPNAKEVLNAGLQHFLGSDYKWQPEYDKGGRLVDRQQRTWAVLHG